MDNMLLRKINFINNSQGSSMLPVIFPNDKIYIKRTSFKSIKINDIVIFKKEKKLITHRVIYKNNKFVITKGDNNYQADGKIYKRNILGIVKKILRNNQLVDLENAYLIQSTIYFSQIIIVKNCLVENNIDHVFLKGLPLHLYFSKSHPKRIYADCDILIRKSDYKKIKALFKKMGYKKSLRTKEVENNYWKTVNGINVIFDVHLEPAFLMTQFKGLNLLYPQKNIDSLTNEMLTTKIAITINDEKFFILKYELLIVFLALHIFHHNFKGSFRYLFLNDVIKYLQSKYGETMFKKVACKIKKYKLETFIYPTFLVLRKFYNNHIPLTFMKTIMPKKQQLNINKINIFDEQPRLESGINRFMNIFILSPSPIWKKFLVFTNPWIAYYIIWSLIKKLSYFSLNRR